ncbi:MAG: hypothetical protein KA319_00620 [Ferruginibacter sp.]|nr:hypothetical protein [Ferruginibacter sp.]
MQIKHSIVIAILIFVSNSTKAQLSFSGIKAGNLSGVLGGTVNPANLADNHYKWDVNLFSVNQHLSNSNQSFKFSTLFDGNSTFFDDVFNSNSSIPVNLNVSAEAVGPSVMYNTGKKWSFGLITRGRVAGNLQEFDPNFLQSINNVTDGTLPQSIASNNNQKLSVTAWSEIGVSAATIINDKSPHVIKAGATIKYLMGYANAFANINQFKGTLNEDISGDVFLSNTTGTIAVGNSGSIEQFNNGDFKKSGSGVGFDIGAVYEFRPDGYEKKYKYKIGLAINDIGSIKYKTTNSQFANYTIDITGGETWYPSELDGLDLNEIKTYLDSKPNLFTRNFNGDQSYKVGLPTTINLSAGMHLHKNFYLDATATVNAAKKTNLYSATYSNTYTVTPYFETNKIGVYLPINYNAISKFNVGFAVKAGPIFIGGSSLINSFFNSKSLDLFAGIRFGGMNKKRNND